MTRRRGRLPALRLAACAAGAGLTFVTACTAPGAAAPHLTLQWTSPPIAGAEAEAQIQLNDAMAHPVTGARLRLEAFMAHPGMAPVLAGVDEEGGGRYRARVRFTMGGDWVVRLQGTRADGRPIDMQEEVRRVRPSP